MTAEELSARLSRPGLFAGLPAIPRDDLALPPGAVIKPAAVLVALVLREEEPGVLLTQRASHLSNHAGQVSFPGGRIELGETPEQAAVREAHEEVALDPSLPRILGRMPKYLTGTGFEITPVIASLRPGFHLAPDPSEVASAFELPLSTLLDPLAPRRERAEFRGRMREFWVWPHGEHYIWGATAAILVNLANALRGG
ncbi:NUDIX hydrolase [Roseococcus sp. YIM B11640]|uniref:NUDIX hydrolase n=1 Tax=Roseococcus sp. YIM B11640 TaxID=3133973 RepID=UPI003C7DEF92